MCLTCLTTCSTISWPVDRLVFSLVRSLSCRVALRWIVLRWVASDWIVLYRMTLRSVVRQLVEFPGWLRYRCY
jgi:hypothetical protein